MYNEVSTNVCTKCNLACTVCFGGTAITCVKCKTPLYFYNIATTSCLNTCPSGYWKDGTDPANPVCSLCQGNCLTCNVDGYDCVTCKENTFLLVGTTGNCVTTTAACGVQYYGNLATRLCTICNPLCA